MMDQPTSQETLAALRRLRDEARERGDETMAVLLSGIDLYASLEREYELLEIMRRFAQEMQQAVENTPTAHELKELYERDDPDAPAGRQ
jgi:hypothetical protein